MAETEGRMGRLGANRMRDGRRGSESGYLVSREYGERESEGSILMIYN